MSGNRHGSFLSPYHAYHARSDFQLRAEDHVISEAFGPSHISCVVANASVV